MSILRMHNNRNWTSRRKDPVQQMRGNRTQEDRNRNSKKFVE